MALKGIDISEHNGLINLEPYRGQFVIIRCGWGHFAEDKQFRRNVAECKRLGIPFGVYHYSYALNAAEAKAEASAVLNLIAPYKNDIKVGVWFDMEDADHWKVNHGWKINHDTIAPICYEFCKSVEDAGYYTGIYTSSSWLQYVSGVNDRFDKWVADWGLTNNGTQQTNTSAYGTMQQYTSHPLDKNVMYVDISTYDMSGNKNTSNEPQKQPAPQPLSSGIAVGDIVRPNSLTDYNGSHLISYHDTYTVSEIHGERAVLTVGGQVWAAMRTSNLTKVGGESAPAHETPAAISYKVGDMVRVIKAITYDGKPFRTWFSRYEVMEVSGDRIVIGVNGVVTAAINAANIAHA